MVLHGMPYIDVQNFPFNQNSYTSNYLNLDRTLSMRSRSIGKPTVRGGWFRL